jgi:hypothetical protein
MSLTKATYSMILGAPTNIKDFGAKCDGVTDDAAAVQAAIDSFIDYKGGTLVIPPNTAIGSTITIADKKNLIIAGQAGEGFPYPQLYDSAWVHTLKWIGAAGGTMLRINNVLLLTMRDLSISGEDTADYGLYFEGSRTGWGVSNYESIGIFACNKNAVYKTRAASAPAGNDFGRNHWVRCSFRKSAAATGTAKNDACYVYDNDSGVQDVFDHCQWIYLDDNTSARPVGTYGLWIEAGTPRIHIRDSYSGCDTGIAQKTSGATAKFYIYGHYSEDLNFVNFPNANTRQVLENCYHALDGGVSVAWAGSAGNGQALVIDGGRFVGTLSLDNTNAPVIFSNAPRFDGGYPTITMPARIVQIGRSKASPASVSNGAINGVAFVPVSAASQNSTVDVLLATGSIFPVDLTGNRGVNAPTNIDSDGLDVGREIEFRVSNATGSVYNLTFNAVYKLAGSAYTHSGAGKTDIIAFRWDGTNWWETRRSMDMS